MTEGNGVIEREADTTDRELVPVLRRRRRWLKGGRRAPRQGRDVVRTETGELEAVGTGALERRDGPADGLLERAPPRRPWRSLSFVMMVLVPFALVAWYYASVASDQFVAEARFVVRTIQADSPQQSGEGAPETGTSALSATSLNQDAYVVTSFVRSHEIVRRIGDKLPLRDWFSDPSIDPWARLEADASQEELLDYWSDQVSAHVDGPSGIVTLQVRAFEPEHARAIAQTIIEESERLVNALSERARGDIVARAETETERAGGDYRAALAALNAYQNEVGILAPELQATAVGKLLTELLARQLETEARLTVLRQGGNTASPAYAQLQRAQDSLEAQVREIRAELAGDAADAAPSGVQISNALVEFSRLETDRLLKEKLYSLAERSLQFARAAATRQSVYVATFSEPFVAEEALYPKRIQTPLLILLALLVAWSTLLLTLASVEDHRR